ncbi:TM2 domain-containing protein [Paenibacillus pinihumi]|uniref:TM2 domain-containing protein n=1 Tax=Paenibacillus pinihumi TaxID=669462 RepID=UPI0004143A01|nr:TM2 domain-containing protein [Paenibacillus pinihumi]
MKDNIHDKRTFTLEELGILDTEMHKLRKTKEAAWALWLCMSFFGAHRFYTENYVYASWMLFTSAAPIVIIMILIMQDSGDGPALFFLWLSVIMLIGSVIWSWVDAIFLNGRIENLNNEKEHEIIRRIMNTR